MSRRRQPRLATLLALAAAPFASLALAHSYALHEVVPGESLGSIANLYRISTVDIREANGLSSELIHPGVVLEVPYVAAVGGPAGAELRLPPGFRWHVLGEGENLSSVAERFGVSLNAMIGANPDISSMDRLPQGVELLVPPAAGLVVKLSSYPSILAVMEEHSVSATELVRANGLRSPFDVTPDMMLFLPGVEPNEALARLRLVREEENRYVWPLHGRLTSYYGARYLGMGTSNFHRGIDIAAPTGTPVRAARAGTVVFAGWSTQGYGNLVRVRHAGNAETWYAHFSSIAVSVGQYVDQGDLVGRVGSTGLSTGPHLHFELHENSRPLDPLAVLR